MTNTTTSRLFLTPADVRHVLDDTAELAQATALGTLCAGAHRAARLATPVGGPLERLLEWERLRHLQSCYWPLILSPITRARALYDWIDVHLRVFDLRWDLTAGFERSVVARTTWQHPLGLRPLGDIVDLDATSRAVEMRADGKHLGYIARHLGVTFEHVADQLVRHGLADRIDQAVGGYREQSADDLDRCQVQLWPRITAARPDPDAAKAVLRIIRRRAEVLGVLQLPPTPGSRR